MVAAMADLTTKQEAYLATRKAVIAADHAEAARMASEALWESYDPSWLAEAEQAQQRARKAQAAKEMRRQVRLESELSAIELEP